ncbi:Osmotically-inducible protein OsmY, contains BON domain [Phyllobacterium sp. YR620]|uniref:BON domain-containing protein n=1 Tax=Phyllobacterium sp. YR620 TaxID=1881066 RepID=UPI000885FD1F|nr:BON domain-containing protein [Phyllobacterium sp. YR620]SDP55322.1 Osmotically-inducible protein OsmY, contains BON domain [Phyllobacterium sp. YR620]
MSDFTLRQNVIDELEFEPSIDGTHIGVTAENGVITLSGHVDTYVEKHKIADVVCRVKGVRGIAQEIEVRPRGQHRTADDEIAKRALSLIQWNTVIPEGTVLVKVENGWVTLTGKVEWNYQKIAAAEAVRGLNGVIDVYNHIEVQPRATPHDVKKRIEDALKRAAEVEAKSIVVDVDDFGKVKLEGSVRAWSERKAVERAAWSAPGVKMVDDRIVVV